MMQRSPWSAVLRAQLSKDVWVELYFCPDRQCLTQNEWDALKAYMDLTMQMLKPEPEPEPTEERPEREGAG